MNLNDSSMWDKVPDGANSHRHLYCGKDLTSAFDDGTFSASVADGSFRDIFPGDYIIKKVTVPAVANNKTSTSEVKFIIADLDVAMNQGSTAVTAHHAVIVPEEPVLYTYMDTSGITEGCYARSLMHDTVMPAFALGLFCAFGEEHLLKCSFDGADDSASDPLCCTCRLMTISMVFGQTALPDGNGGLTWSDVKKDNCLGGVQLAAFRLNHDLWFNAGPYWVSDLTSSSLSLTFVRATDNDSDNDDDSDDDSDDFDDNDDDDDDDDDYTVSVSDPALLASWGHVLCGVRPFALLI